MWNWIYSINQCTYVELLKEKPGLSSYFPASNPDPSPPPLVLNYTHEQAKYGCSSDNWPSSSSPPTEQRGYVRKEIPFVTVRCRVAFTRIIHNPSPKDSRGPAEGFWTSPICHVYSPTIHLREAHNKRWCSLRSHVVRGEFSIWIKHKSLHSYWWNKRFHHCYRSHITVWSREFWDEHVTITEQRNNAWRLPRPLIFSAADVTANWY